MSAHATKIINFPESAARAEISVCAKASHYDSLRVGNNPMPLNNPFRPRLPELPACGKSEAVIGLGAAFAFHLFWLAVAPPSEQQAPVTPPMPIQVAWISSPQPRAEPPKPAPPKPQKKPKPAVKPKAKPRKPAPAKPKPLISSSNSASEITVAKTAETPKTPIAPSPPPAPAVASAPDKSPPAEAAPLTLPHLNADYLDNPPPTYPRISRRLGEQGKVLLRAMINTDGTVAQLVVRKTSGFSRLDQAALETVKNWRFVPARRGGQIVPAWVVVPISFSLEG
jgi:protein TonB